MMADPRVPPGARTEQQHRRLCFTAMLLMVIATVSWRRGIYYTGGVDPVVAGKAILSFIALTMAWFARQANPNPRPVAGRTMLLLVAYLVVSTFGAYIAGEVVPSSVLAVRVFILGLTVYFLVRTFSVETLFRDLIRAMLTVGIVSAATGLPTLGSEGRLFGGIPPLHANEIAMLFAVPLIGLAWLALQGRMRGRHVLLLVVSLGVIWLSGSRTGLAAALIATAVMLLQARRLNRPVAVIVAAMIPLGFYFIFASEAVQGYFQRGGTEQVTTFGSRTIAWTAAWSFPDTMWERWMGTGLSQKLIPVQGQWWDVQLLDSTWVSALVQAGLLGVLILTTWLVLIVSASVRAPAPARMLFTALLTFLTIRSFLESGLFDSTTAFLTLMLISLTSDGWSRREQARERSGDNERLRATPSRL